MKQLNKKLLVGFAGLLLAAGLAAVQATLAQTVSSASPDSGVNPFNVPKRRGAYLPPAAVAAPNVAAVDAATQPLLTPAVRVPFLPPERSPFLPPESTGLGA